MIINNVSQIPASVICLRSRVESGLILNSDVVTKTQINDNTARTFLSSKLLHRNDNIVVDTLIIVMRSDPKRKSSGSLLNVLGIKFLINLFKLGLSNNNVIGIYNFVDRVICGRFTRLLKSVLNIYRFEQIFNFFISYILKLTFCIKLYFFIIRGIFMEFVILFS